MIMKTEKFYSWVLRVSNLLTGDIEYRAYTCLTTTEIEQAAKILVSNNRNFYVSIYKLHKMF